MFFSYTVIRFCPLTFHFNLLNLTNIISETKIFISQKISYVLMIMNIFEKKEIE